MENDSPADSPAGSPADDASADAPTAGEARAALEAMDADATRLAERLVTPWWYHLTLGALVALAIGALAQPLVSAIVVMPLVIIWIPFLVKAYNDRYGIATTQPGGPRSRRMLLLILAVLAVFMGAGVLVKLSSLSTWWAVVPAVLGFLATVALGRRYDEVLRSELARPAEQR